MRKTAGIAERSRGIGIALVISALMSTGFAIGAAGAGVDTTTLDLDRHGADVFPAVMAEPAIVDAPSGIDISTLYLDRNGADMPSSSWWEMSTYAGDADTRHGPDSADLNLDRDGADIANR